MGLRERLSKPHYLFRPTQLVWRAVTRSHNHPEPVTRVAWGGSMVVARDDHMGAGIARLGVHELAVSEVMWRLTKPEDLALDVGANIGYFTGLLATRARQVVAFEPNPLLTPFLTSNKLRWGSVGMKVELDFRAVSDSPGTAVLHLPAAFASNNGLATLATTEGGDHDHEVETVTIDTVVAGRPVGVMKVDVEGHELAVFKGASGTLEANLIRDILFEDHQRLPSPVSLLLEEAGFSIFGVEEALLGPRLIPSTWTPRGWDAPTYLATRRPEEARVIVGRRGWQVLYPRLAQLRHRP